MDARNTRRPRELVDALGAELGVGRVTSCLEEGDRDPRTSSHISGRDIGRPSCWVRPQTTAECAAVVRIAGAHGAVVCPVGEATTFWDGLRLEAAVALDMTALRAPLAIDRARRLAWAGAGCSVRAVDRAARAEGLCLAAYPDSAGDSPVGALVAVGTTAGLGMGRVLPIEQVTGATVVLGTGEIVRTGASHALGAAAFIRHGLPDLLGLFTAAEGRSALITEVGLALSAAPFSVRGVASGAMSEAPNVADLRRLLGAARRALDRGALETFRFELGAGGEGDARWEVMFRSASPRSAADAHEEAARLKAAIDGIMGKPVVLQIETDEARAGALPAYDERFSCPPGDHRARLQGGAFWGAEIATSWGDDLGSCLHRLLALYEELRVASPLHRRLGIYPASHSVSSGVQVLGRPGTAAELVSILSAALPDLLAAGGVPYRTGNLWRPALAAHLGAMHGDATAATERSLRALDPHGVLPGPRAGGGGRAA